MKTRNQRIIEVIQASELPGAVVHTSSRTSRGHPWNKVDSPAWDFMLLDYRVSIPSEPTTRRIAKKDWDGRPVIWVCYEGGKSETLVTSIHDVGFSVGYEKTNSALWNTHDYDLYSFDRITWHPFTITEPRTGMKVVASTEEA